MIYVIIELINCQYKAFKVHLILCWGHFVFAFLLSSSIRVYGDVVLIGFLPLDIGCLLMNGFNFFRWLIAVCCLIYGFR